MDLYAMETSFAITVLAGVAWILVMIFAVVWKIFNESLVLGVIGASCALAVPVAAISVYLRGQGWNGSEFLVYFVFWWLVFGLVMTLLPIWRWIRRQVW